MTRGASQGLPRVAWVLAIPFLLPGCATKGDLEQVRRELHATSAQVESLKSETKSALEAAQRQLEAREQRLVQRLTTLEESLAQLTQAVADQRAKLAESTRRSESLTKDAQELRRLVQSTSRTLAEFFKVHESQLQDGLRWVQSVLKSLAVHTTSAEGPSEGASGLQPKGGQSQQAN